MEISVMKGLQRGTTDKRRNLPVQKDPNNDSIYPVRFEQARSGDHTVWCEEHGRPQERSILPELCFRGEGLLGPRLFRLSGRRRKYICNHC